MKPFIDPSFWSDPDIESAKPSVKLTALWLITNSQTSLLGVCGASLSRFVFETGLPVEALDSALQALSKSFVKVGSFVFSKNYIRHQFGTGEKLTKNNFFVAMKSIFLAIKNPDLQAVILSEYPEFEQALTKGLGRAYQAQGEDRIGKEGEKGSAEGKPKRAKKTPVITIPESLDTPAFREHWEMWSNYRKERGKPLAETTIDLQLKTLEKMGEARAIAALIHSAGNGWEGIFEPKATGGKPMPAPQQTAAAYQADLVPEDPRTPAERLKDTRAAQAAEEQASVDEAMASARGED